MLVWGSANYILSRKIKEIKTLLKAWNMDCFGRVEVNKKLALAQVEAWDVLKTRGVCLWRNLRLRRRQRTPLKGGLPWKKFIRDKNPRRPG